LDDENDDIQYSWLREYHWEVCVFCYLFFDCVYELVASYSSIVHTRFMIQVRGDDKDDPTTYLVTFDKKDGAKYLVISDVHSVL
jgi:RNA polymerase II-associated factor 1